MNSRAVDPLTRRAWSLRIREVSTGPTLCFVGGAGTVTGSKHLIRAAGRQILLDCGLFQGLKALRLRNWDRPPFDPADIDAVVLSHAHVDHSGYLPLLARRGFRGPIYYCTAATKDLLEVMLLDAAHLERRRPDARRLSFRVGIG